VPQDAKHQVATGRHFCSIYVRVSGQLSGLPKASIFFEFFAVQINNDRVPKGWIWRECLIRSGAQDLFTVGHSFTVVTPGQIVALTAYSQRN
jgi:hypothetical protein